jgi:flagellar biosynthesis protein FliQ
VAQRLLQGAGKKVFARARVSHMMRTSRAQVRPILSDMEAFDSLLRQTIVLCASLALPILLSATIVGTLVAIVQAATQVQEQTLTLLPKIAAVGAVVVLFGHFGFVMASQLFYNALASVPDIVRAVPSQ